MNTWQAAKQLQFLLQKRVWPDAPGGNVFASVHVTQGPAEDSANDFRFPLAIIRVLDSTSDPQSPGLKDQRLEVVLATANAGDQVGEFALVGGQRNSQGSSKGRGLLEVEEQFAFTLNFADQTVGVHIYEVVSGTAEASLVEGRGYVVSRAYTIAAVLTTARNYPAPNGSNALINTVPGFSGSYYFKSYYFGPSASVKLSWIAAQERFDCHPAYASTFPVPIQAARGSLILVRKAGSSAPASTSDGTPITITGGVFGTSATDAPGPGIFTYGLFAQFDEFNDGVTSLRYSPPAIKTVSV